MARHSYSTPTSHPLQDLQVAEWPSIQVLLAPRTEGWRNRCIFTFHIYLCWILIVFLFSLHYDMHGYVEVDAVTVLGNLPGYSQPIKLSLHSVELDFRFWQKCRMEPASNRGSEHHDIGGSGSPRLYCSETMVQFFAPHSITPQSRSEVVKLRYPFKATVPCTMFHMTSYEADRFFECTARAWYTPNIMPPGGTQPGATAPMSIACPPSRTSRAYMPPKARSHTLRSYEYPEPPAKPPPRTPFRHCRVLR
ncbi:hypothetical protein FPV67DRAFT_1095886 [Lyophyllum atratum]|nr:hypothetical protein FPV67DRAFT_1095886 [Lyophyllum atratum]